MTPNAILAVFSRIPESWLFDILRDFDRRTSVPGSRYLALRELRRRGLWCSLPNAPERAA